MTAPLVVPVAGYMTLSRFVRCRSRPATSSSLGMACLLRRCGGGALPSHLRRCAQLLPPVDPRRCTGGVQRRVFAPPVAKLALGGFPGGRSEEHTSELQSRGHLVCRLLLEKKNNQKLNRKETVNKP